jgi:hypothetical protein
LERRLHPRWRGVGAGAVDRRHLPVVYPDPAQSGPRRRAWMYPDPAYHRRHGLVYESFSLLGLVR